MKNYYEVLGIDKSATSDDIKKAYRSLAFKYHPDRNPGDTVAEEKFKEISAAYDVLGDETKRRNYDLTGQTETYTNSSYTYNTYRNANTYNGNPFTDEETFWQWFTGASGQTQRNSSTEYNNYSREYRYSNSNKKENYDYSRSQYLAMIFLKGVQTLFALSFFRYSFFIIPIGPILCIMMLVNGVHGFIQGIKGFFSKFRR